MSKFFSLTATIKGKTMLLVISFLGVLISFSMYVFFQAGILKNEYKVYTQNWEPLRNNVAESTIEFSTQQALVYKALYSENASLEREGQEKKYADGRVASLYRSYLDYLNITNEYESKLRTGQKVYNSLYAIKYDIFRRIVELKKSDNRVNISSDSLINKVYLPDLDKTIATFSNDFRPLVLSSFNKKAESVASALNNRLKWLVFTVVVISILLAVIYFILWQYFVRTLSKSVSTSIGVLDRLALGELPHKAETTSDEFSAIISSANRLSENMRNASNFTVEIGKGNFNFNFTPVCANDVLGNALIAMKDDLQEYSIKEKQLNWSNTGQTKFGELLRNTHRSLKELCDELLTELVAYLKANQAGIYLQNENTKNLDLISCYAYERKKFINNSIEPGEGLLGQCFLEGENIHMTQIPKGYMSITSGLGSATPKSLLLVPVKTNGQVVGVIEIASFNDFFDFQISFLEKISENIAAMVSAVMRDNLNRKLLQETIVASENIREQEEEMRQNVEELHAIQEQMQRKELKYIEEIENLKGKSGRTVIFKKKVDSDGF